MEVHVAVFRKSIYFFTVFCANLEYVYTLRQKSISEILTVDPLKKMKSLNVCQRCNSNERDRMYINNLVLGFLKNIYIKVQKIIIGSVIEVHLNTL